MWGPEVKLLDYKFYFADPRAGQMGFFGTLEEHGHPAILGLRLKVDNRRIGEMKAVAWAPGVSGTACGIGSLYCDRPGRRREKETKAKREGSELAGQRTDRLAALEAQPQTVPVGKRTAEEVR